MSKPPRDPTPRPPGVPLPVEGEIEDPKQPPPLPPPPAAEALTEALQKWPAECRPFARGSDPPPTKTIEEILNEDVFKRERPKRQRTRISLLTRLLRALRLWP